MPTHVTHGEVKLGKRPARRSLKSLPLSAYMRSGAVPFPPVHAWERPIEWGMLGNDTVGDCTIAAALHMITGWQAVANAGPQLWVYSNAEALTLYSAITGYNPADPSTDQGAVELDVLNYWRDTGMLSHKIAGYVTLDVGNIDQIKAACYVFGGVYLGFSVPSYIMNVPSGGSWSARPGVDTSIEGGHAIYIAGYGKDGARCVSWGTTYTFDWQFWSEYVDEAYGIVSQDWIRHSGTSPSGLSMTALIADLQGVKA